jgi:SAM-dependent methyltransferase
LSEGDLLAIKRSEQLYADVSSKLAPDDFERDLRKLESSPECATCPKRKDCGWCWVPAATNVFARDRHHLEGILSTLRGRVLDVGCGDGPYVRAIGERVAAGAASYLGVDPDARRVNVLGSRYPWASYFTGDLGSFLESHREARFDHVLVLRSYNHLPDPAGTLELAIDLLEPGGTLLVVDNVAFGLLRSAEQASRAETGPAAFEHFRNDGTEDAEAHLSRSSLELVERRDVTPRGSNEWLLHYRKMEEKRDDRRA